MPGRFQPCGRPSASRYINFSILYGEGLVTVNSCRQIIIEIFGSPRTSCIFACPYHNTGHATRTRLLLAVLLYRGIPEWIARAAGGMSLRQPVISNIPAPATHQVGRGISI